MGHLIRWNQMLTLAFLTDHLLLTKRVSWTMKGVVLPVDKQHGKTKPILSNRLKKLTENGSVRILVFRNGTGQDGYEIITPLDEKQQVKIHYFGKNLLSAFLQRSHFFPEVWLKVLAMSSWQQSFFNTPHLFSRKQ